MSTVLPAFSLFDNPKTPGRSHVLAERVIVNAHGVGVKFKIEVNWPGNKWWFAASIGTFRHSNTAVTSSKAKAEKWMADLAAGNVTIEERT